MQSVVTKKIAVEDEYENYDFGENGIYQNIIFNNSDSAIKSVDLNSQVHTLRKSVNEVNRIVQENKPHEIDESQPLKLYQSKLNISLKLPTNNIMKKDEQENQKENVKSFVPNKKCVKSEKNAFSKENTQKNENQGRPSGLKKPTNSIFRKWALSKAEHPKIDLTKFNETQSFDTTKSKTSFTNKEKEIVAKFLEDVKSELSS